MLKRKITAFILRVREKPGLFVARAVLCVAFCGFIASCWLYSAAGGGGVRREGTQRHLGLSAQAEGLRVSAEVLAAVLAKETVAEGGTDAAMASALKRVYRDLAGSGYFVLWRGTVDVCSPLTPDTAGLDFGAQRDATGAYFVRELAEIASRGGGFHSFILAYEAPPGGGGAAPRGFKSEFLAYAVPVPGSSLHLTLWRPADPAAFSLRAEFGDDPGHWSLLGLCMSGLSFLGVSVLLRGLKN